MSAAVPALSHFLLQGAAFDLPGLCYSFPLQDLNDLADTSPWYLAAQEYDLL